MNFFFQPKLIAGAMCVCTDGIFFIISSSYYVKSTPLTLPCGEFGKRIAWSKCFFFIVNFIFKVFIKLSRGVFIATENQNCNH